MPTEYATAEHFAQWEQHSKTCDYHSLKYIVADCLSAAGNMKGWNPVKEGFYLDQAYTYADEIRRRKMR